jgi:hypothetical protein
MAPHLAPATWLRLAIFPVCRRHHRLDEGGRPDVGVGGEAGSEPDRVGDRRAGADRLLDLREVQPQAQKNTSCSSTHNSSAIDQNSLTCDPATHGREQESDRPCQFLWFPDTGEWPG